MNRTRIAGAISPRRSASAAAVDLGHHDVGQQQVDRAGRSRHMRAASSASCDGQDLVAVGLEHQPHEVAHAVVVLDDQDRLGAAGRLGLGDGLGGLGGPLAAGR